MNWLPLPTNLLPYWFFPWNTETWAGFTPFIYHKELLAIDALRQIFIWKDYAFGLIKQGIWPLWNPYNFSGQPLLANFQTAVFYPPSWIFLLLPNIAAWTIYIYIQPILAGLFMYLFLRNKPFSKITSSFGALALVFCSYFATRYFWGVNIHPLLWIPLGLLLTDKLAAGRISKTVFVALLAVVLALSILGGYPQHGVFAVVLMTGYFLVHISFRRWWLILASLTLALALGAVQLLPTLELHKYSLREGTASQEVFNYSQLEPRYLVSIFSPDFWGNPGANNYFGGKDYGGMNGYFGVIPLVLALYAVIFLRQKREVKFWAGVALASLLFAYKTPLAQLPQVFNIPILSSGGAWGNLFFFQFAGVILSAFGLEKALKERDRNLFKIIVLVLAFLILLLAAGRNFVISVRNTGLILGMLAVFAAGYWLVFRRAKFLAILLLTFGGVFYLQKVSPFGELRYFYPQHDLISFLQENATIDRFIGFGPSRIASNFATYFKIQSPEGYDSLWPRWYGELISAAETGNISERIERAEAIITDADTPSRRKLLNLLGVKYFLDFSHDPLGDRGHNETKFSKERFILLKQWGVLSVYENKEALPRAFLANQGLVKEMFTEGANLRETIFLEEEPMGNQKLATGEAEIIAYMPNAVTVRTDSSGPSLLFLSDTYFPGWKAFINGKEEKIHRADYAFRAVSIPKGQNEVRFIYQPESFKWGIRISLTGLVMIICLILSKLPQRIIRCGRF